jgi:hypothetical protein
MIMFRDSHRPTVRDVISVYKALLGREPENDRIIESQRRADSLESLIANIKNSDEFRTKERNHPFFYYNSTFDAINTIRRHAERNVRPDPAYLTNYLGVRVSPRVCPAMLEGRAGEVEALPIPGNWHADIAEFAAVLRSVELAVETFTMAELGCGWGCWMNNAGTVAKRLGLKVSLIGVEGDKGHILLAKEALDANGFSPHEIEIFWGVAAPKEGFALFPCQTLSGTSWGLEPVFNADSETRAKAVEAGTHYELPMVPLSQLITDEGRPLDLLHIDIQGGEADLVHQSLDLINKHVRYMFIGTHSREIEGRLFADLIPAGWQLEIERPAILSLDDGPRVVTDGVQGWRNRLLVPHAGAE